jgi:phospholipid/cholesterol/gamma-HCH transport system substrate-binding protein
MSNETKIGLLSIVTIALFIYGFKFIKGQNILSTSQTIYVKYEQVDLMAVSSPVLINGFQVGVVTDIYLDPESGQDIIAVLDIQRGIKIHKDASAEIISASMMGGKAIRIMNNQPCTEGNCAKSGDYIKGRTVGMLEAMIPQGDMDLYLSTIKNSISPAFDSLNQALKNPDEDNVIGKTMQDLQASMANLKQITDQLNSLLSANANTIKRTMGNLESITGNVKSSNHHISNMLANADSLTAKLKAANINATLDKANQALGSTDEAITQLKETLKKAEATLASLNEISRKITEGDGAMAMLINDPVFAQKLSTTITNLDALLVDVNLHPYNYMPLKSRRKVIKWRKEDQKNQQ